MGPAYTVVGLGCSAKRYKAYTCRRAARQGLQESLLSKKSILLLVRQECLARAVLRIIHRSLRYELCSLSSVFSMVRTPLR